MARKIIIVLIVICGVGVILNWGRIRSYFKEDTRSVNKQEVKLLIRTPPSFSQLIDLLIENKIISDSKMIRTYVQENSVDTNKFAAGKYVILSQTRMEDLVGGFIMNGNGQGKAEVKVKVLFNRCYDIYDIGSNISKCILADSASIVDAIYSQETLSKYNFTKEQIPALFLPDEYEMYFDTDAEEFIALMAEEFKRFWDDERKTKLKKLGFTAPSQVVTLASIVYAEQSKVPEEWGTIAGLYLNRLEKGMLLQSDPTFKFCWGKELEGQQRLLYKHRDKDCPYNTYLYKGLPPGPIRITPGKVIDAVLDPEDVNYIFMCAQPNYSGKHNFTASGSVHERNAAIYQRWLAKELAKKNQ